MDVELSNAVASNLVTLGRILLGGVFVFAGLRNIGNRALLTEAMTARGVPLPALTLFAGVTVQIVAGAALVAGIQVPLAAAALVVFVVLATPMFSNFWNHEGQMRANAINSFLSNVALTGGLLIAATSGA